MKTTLSPHIIYDPAPINDPFLPLRDEEKWYEELTDEKDIVSAKGPAIRCVGSGIFNLDTVVVRAAFDLIDSSNLTEREIAKEVGGTCGNVMCLLSLFGLETYPQVQLDDSPEGMKIRDDLERYGCNLKYVTNSPEGGTTLLRVTLTYKPKEGVKVSVRAGSPGGSRFPRRKFLRARDQAPAFVETLTSEFIPEFYFFDSPAVGHRYIARELRPKGTTVYFEPSAVSTKADMECVALSDIIKLSNENVPDTSFADGFSDKLFVQTLGKDGLRYKFRSGNWKTLPGIPNEKAIDPEGAGDWVTAAIIKGITLSGKRLDEMEDDDVEVILTAAQRLASRKLSFIGTKIPYELY